MTDVDISNLAGADPRHYLAYSGTGTADVTDRFDRFLDAGRYQPEWMYVAMRNGEVVARASCFCNPDDGQPVAVDHFDISPSVDDPVAVGATLLRRLYDDIGGRDPMPDLHMFLPAGWRAADDAVAIATRIAAAENAGLSVLVERHRFEWLAEPDDEPRLDVVPPSELSVTTNPSDDVLVDLLRAISVGSLDTGTVREVERLGVDGAARSYVHDMTGLPGGRDHWLVAHSRNGDPAAIVIATMATQPHPQVAFIGVDPAHRGKGYGVALLREATTRLAAAGANRVRGDTDMTNVPMINVFRTCGWRPWATRLVMQCASNDA